MTERPYYTVRQFAERLQVSNDSVLALIHSNRLHAINVSTGKRPTWRIPLDSIAKFEAGQSTTPAVEPTRRGRRLTTGVIEFF